MKNIFVIFIMVLICSCNNKKDKSSVSYDKKVKLINQLKEKYSTDFVWDSKEIYNKKYSIEFKDIVNSDIQLIQYFEVVDISSEIGKVYLLLEVDYKYIFKLEVKKELYSKIIEIGKYTESEQPCMLVVNIEQLRKLPISLIADIDFIDEEDVSVYLDYVPTDKLYGTGYLINIECIN